MKRTFPTIVAAVLAVSATMPVLQQQVAFADDGHHASGKVHEAKIVTTSTTTTTTSSTTTSSIKPSAQAHGPQTDLQEALIALLTSKWGAEWDNKLDNDKLPGHAKHGDGDDNDDQDDHAPKPVPAPSLQQTLHKQQVAQLHTEINQLHKDEQAAKQARDALSKATKDYVTVMRQALRQSNAAVIKTGMDGIQPILLSVTTALHAQADADEQSKSSMKAGEHGDLTNVLTAMAAADARLKAKTTAIVNATTALQALVKKLQAQLGTATTTSTWGSEGNVTITVGASSNTH